MKLHISVCGYSRKIFKILVGILKEREKSYRKDIFGPLTNISERIEKVSNLATLKFLSGKKKIKFLLVLNFCAKGK